MLKIKRDNRYVIEINFSTPDIEKSSLLTLKTSDNKEIKTKLSFSELKAIYKQIKNSVI